MREQRDRAVILETSRSLLETEKRATRDAREQGKVGTRTPITSMILPCSYFFCAVPRLTPAAVTIRL